MFCRSGPVSREGDAGGDLRRRETPPATQT